VKREKFELPPARSGKSLVWDSATGKYFEEDLPSELADLVVLSELTAPGQGGLAAVKRENAAPSSARGAGLMAAAPVGVPPSSSSSYPRPLPAAGSTTRRGPLLEAERLIAEGRATASFGDPAEAYKHYQEGIRRLLVVLPEDGGPEAAALKDRLDQYLTEAERLRALLGDDPPPTSQPSGQRQPSGREPMAPAAPPAAWQQQQHGSSSSSASSRAALDQQVAACEAAFRDAYALENWGFPERAREQLRRGVADFLDAVRLLGEQAPSVSVLAAEVQGRLARSSSLSSELRRAGVTAEDVRQAIFTGWKNRGGIGPSTASFGGRGARPPSSAPRVVPPPSSHPGWQPTVGPSSSVLRPVAPSAAPPQVLGWQPQQPPLYSWLR